MNKKTYHLKPCGGFGCTGKRFFLLCSICFLMFKCFSMSVRGSPVGLMIPPLLAVTSSPAPPLNFLFLMWYSLSALLPPGFNSSFCCSLSCPASSSSPPCCPPLLL